MDTNMILPCKLCRKNLADKKNSHIVPRFLTKDILGNDGPRVAHILDTSTPFSKPSSFQDSPKENHILCTECENYFGLLETYIADRIGNRYINPYYRDNFTLQNSGQGIDFIICEKVSPIITKLFVYSIFWRCSISKSILFSGFSLNITEEELLRQFLIGYKNKHLKDVTEDVFSNDFPYVIFRTKHKDPDPSKNFLYANNGNKDIYQIIANEYIFLLAFETSGTILTLKILINQSNDKVKIGLLSKNSWENLRQGLYSHAASIAVKNANKTV